MKQFINFLKSASRLVFRHPLLGTSIIPVLPDGRIVLIQRRDNGKWGLPGGMVEWGEDIRSSVERELTEETGLQVVSMGRLVGVYSSPHRDARFHSICVALEVQATGMLKVEDTLEIQMVQAFVRSDLPQGQLNADNDQQLQDYFNGHTVIL
jgi:ADP-ribose pyrophosphatase YjhB (NUDIX family)